MICAELEDRLFDEDCRAALAGRGPVPADVATHVGSCATCGATWSLAATETRRLSQRLVAAPPPALRRALYRAFGSRTWARVPHIDLAFLSWAVAGGAFGASLAGNWLGSAVAPQCAGFCLGASGGVLLSALQQAHGLWADPLTSLRGAAIRCADRLAQMI